MQIEQGTPTLLHLKTVEVARLGGFHHDVRRQLTPIIQRLLQEGIWDRGMSSNILAALRLYHASAEGSARSSFAPHVALALEHAAFVIGQGYHHPDVQAVVADIKIGPFGEEYDFSAEMLRDESRFWWKVYGLTGGMLHYGRALRTLDVACACAEKNDIKKLLQFEAEEYRWKQIDPEFPRPEFQDVEKAAIEAWFAAGSIARWERMVTIASRLAGYALQTGKWSVLPRALLVAGWGVWQDPTLWRIPLKEIARPFHAEWRRFRLQSTTPHGASYDELGEELLGTRRMEKDPAKSVLLLAMYDALSRKGKFEDDGRLVVARGCSNLPDAPRNKITIVHSVGTDLASTSYNPMMPESKTIIIVEPEAEDVENVGASCFILATYHQDCFIAPWTPDRHVGSLGTRRATSETIERFTTLLRSAF